MQATNGTTLITIPFPLILKATNTPFTSQGTVEMLEIRSPTLPWGQMFFLME